MKRGFTIVEVLITLVVIGILLGLGTVGLRSTLAKGRDAERLADVQAMSYALEKRYDTGNLTHPTVYLPQTYPGNNEFWNGPFWHGQHSLNSIFPDINLASLISPSGESYQVICLLFTPYGGCNGSAQAENPTRIRNTFLKPDGVTYYDRYLYEFIGAPTGDCDSNQCVRYNIYWISETDQTPYLGVPGLKVLRSKHQ